MWGGAGEEVVVLKGVEFPTLIKKKIKFSSYKEIQSVSVAKSYMRNLGRAS
jgi:hypothetical protein